MASFAPRIFRSSLIDALALPIVLVGIWQLAISRGWWPQTLIASPLDVIVDFGRLTASGELLGHAWASLGRLLGGFALGTSLGVLIGSIVGVSLAAERFLAPTIQALTPIPPPAWIPLLIILFGIGEASKIGLITIGAFAVVYVNTVQGIRGADQGLVEVASTFQKSRTELSFFVLLPSAAPSIITGMRVALGLSWILLVAAEMLAARLVSEGARLQGLGLGWLIYDARRFSRADDMIVGMIAIGLLGKLTDMVMGYLQDRVLGWRGAFKGA